MKSEHILKAMHLAVGYEEKVVIQDVSLEIPNGKISVIIGANACGKSTLLKAMTRIITPKAGTVTLDGQSVHAMNPKQLAKICSLRIQLFLKGLPLVIWWHAADIHIKNLCRDKPSRIWKP